MNKKLLCAALLGGLGVAQAASAQDFDDRWYLTGDIGYNHQDSSRDTENAMFATLGLGKFINRNWSLDGQLNWQNPKANDQRRPELEPVRRFAGPASPLHRRRPQLESVPPDGPGLPARRTGIQQLPEPGLPGTA